MAPEVGHIGPLIIRAYTVLVDLALLVGLGALTWWGWHHERRPTAWFDAGLIALVGGIIVGRMGHVALQWAYFSTHLGEIAQVWRGGIDWHGAIIGGLVGLALGCRLRHVEWRRAVKALTVPLPLGAALSYTACLTGNCAHGREVASLAFYPPLVAAELPDLYGIVAPRLNSQLFGIVWSLLVLAVVALSSKRIGMSSVRPWIALALLGLGAFAIGFTRGDAAPVLGTMRLDQMLDLGIVILGVGGVWDAVRRVLKRGEVSHAI